MATVPDMRGSLGVPTSYTEALTVPYGGLFIGSSPAPVIVDRIVAASQTIPAFTPVGLDGNGRLIPAVYGTTQAIGVTVTDIVTDASTTYKGAPVARAGALDFDKVVWPASYDNDTKKWGAFDGAPTPTQIVLKRVKLGDPT